jgi:hypothetical protein
VEARGGRSSRDIGSKPIAGIVKLDVKRSNHSSFYRGGAGAARGAHNSEDIGSKPISGIIHQFASVYQGTSAVRLSDYKQSGYGLVEIYVNDCNVGLVVQHAHVRI